VSFVSDQTHRKNIAERDCDELRIFVDEQFQSLRKIFVNGF
jgi:hypothetical protein